MTAGDLSVRSAFETSFCTLPPSACGIDSVDSVRLLGLWPGRTISTAAAAALFGSNEEDAAMVLDLLADAHLLAPCSPHLYVFHDLFRLYASEQALAELTDDERSAAIARFLHWYLRAADAVATAASPYRYTMPVDDPANGEPPTPELTGPEGALAWYGEEYANVLAVTRQAAAAGMYDIAWRLPVSMFWIFDTWDNWSECAAQHLIALDNARQAGDRRGEAWVLNNLGVASGWTGEPQAAEYLERSLEIRREIGDLLGQAQSASNLARLYLQVGRGEEAASMLYQTLNLTRETSHRYGEGVVLISLGDVLLGLNRPAEAIGRAQRARNIFTELNSREGIAYSLHCIGRCFMKLGRLFRDVNRERVGAGIPSRGSQWRAARSAWRSRR
jgi:tetratricopeptide (TPR) repeat protein